MVVIVRNDIVDPMRKPALALIALAVLALAASVAGAKSKKKPREKYFVNVVGVEAAAGIPDDVTEKLKAKLADVLAKREEFVPTLEGAPDPAADAPGFKKWLAKNKVRAFAVTIKVTAWEREVLPPKEGKTGQILSQHFAVSLIGTAMPDDLLALGGDGMATVKAEVGKKIRPADESFVVESAISEALQQAVQDAVESLGKPVAKPQKK